MNELNFARHCCVLCSTVYSVRSKRVWTAGTLDCDPPDVWYSNGMATFHGVEVGASIAIGNVSRIYIDLYMPG